MKTYRVSIQVIKVYHVEVEAQSGAAAIMKVSRMQTEDIYKQGSLRDVETDHIMLADVQP